METQCVAAFGARKSQLTSSAWISDGVRVKGEAAKAAIEGCATGAHFVSKKPRKEVRSSEIAATFDGLT